MEKTVLLANVMIWALALAFGCEIDYEFSKLPTFECNSTSYVNGSRCHVRPLQGGEQCCCKGLQMTCGTILLTEIPVWYPAAPFHSSTCSLNLSHNIISFIPNRSFSNSTLKAASIEYLYLDNNIISFICSEGFHGLTNLKVLNISSNRLVWLGNFGLGGNNPLRWLYSLRFIYMKGNTFNNFTGLGLLMKNLTKLEALYINPTSIEGNYVLETEFRSLRHLVDINFAGNGKSCQLGKIENNTFVNVPYVKRLSLSNCRLQNASEDSLKHVNNTLVSLDISGNEDLEFSGMNDVLAGLENSTVLTVLNASRIHYNFGLGIKWQFSDFKYVKTFKVLRELHVDANKIEVLDTKLLYPECQLPDSLKFISLSGNRLTAGNYTNFLYMAKSLTSLDISSQNLNYGPFAPHEKTGRQNDYSKGGNEKAIHGKLLQVLGLQNVSSLNFKHSSRSITLNLQINCSCGQEKDPNFVCLPPNLNTVDWSNGHVYADIPPMVICGASNLKKVDISQNILQTWIGPLLGLQSLSVLILSDNYCEYISDWFFIGFLKLEVLNISRNSLFKNFNPKFKEYNGDIIFKNLRRLKVLDMSEIKLSVLSMSVFESLISLERLYLDNNYLNVWSVLFRSETFQYLSLAGNKFQTLPIEIMSYLDTMSKNKTVTLDLAYLPLECGCEQLPLWKWLTTTHVHVQFNPADHCMLNGRVQTFVNISAFRNMVHNLENFECVDRRWVSVVLSGVSAFAGITITLICSVLMYKNRWKLRYIYYSRKRRYVVTGFERLFAHDAMISYAKGRASFIKNTLVPSLERPNDLSLWVTDRDSIPGVPVAENITQAVCSSRKTVLLVDKEYLTDWWCEFDMNMALVESIESKRKLVILVLMENFEIDQLPVHVLRILRNECSLEYPNNAQDLSTFWTNLALEIQS